MGAKSINIVKIKTQTNIELKEEKVISFDKKWHHRIERKEYFALEKNNIEIGPAINFINSAPSNMFGSK